MNGELLLVGCGNMGRAMLQGWLAAGFVRPDDVHVVEPAESLRAEAGALGVSTYASAEALDAALRPATVVLAVKPQVMAAVLPAYRPHVAEGVVVSIAAGIPVSALEAGLGKVAAVRAMPNTPAAIGKGSTVIFANERVSPQQAEQVVKFLSAGGAVHRVEHEALIDAATALSGSGPAYVFHFIEGLAEVGTQLGLPPQTALALARETVFGAGALAIAADIPPAELRRQVSSPGGTTEAALLVLTENDALKVLLSLAATAAHHRAVELAKMEA
ncbi:pyrroline-5-carboxylate reductase [Pararhizobium sp. YC-54]|uniref:pyrroline-5-carboxylate reductase n=1 Tax=Pararhizobium sp. YC-54 TaxID=2986920 RepID=UPI0021F6AC56|nr:pyrroline-5-carboxylate reductase [Pararhizobium sp. YC-54]MCW0001090.1 pyrroline-5-carboxylate reductase [Pararhizobium sp. YC-54]